MIPYINTFSGRRVNPLKITPADVCIEDINHALSLINRFNGHTRTPVSVAQHSVTASHVAQNMGLSPTIVFQTFLHDGAEAYVGDVTKWLKMDPSMTAFREAEESAQRAVYRAFGLPEEQAEEVEYIDRLMVRWEAEQQFTEFDFRGDARYPAVTAEEKALIGRWPELGWQGAKYMHMQRFLELYV